MMKQLQLIAACIIIMLFPTFIRAEKPIKANLVANIIDKLDIDVKLNKKQKDILKSRVNIYIAKMQSANTRTLDGEKFFYNKQASVEFEASVDSILSAPQKELRKAKQEERKTAETTRNKKK
jgi:hypothetical protein